MDDESENPISELPSAPEMRQKLDSLSDLAQRLADRMTDACQMRQESELGLLRAHTDRIALTSITGSPLRSSETIPERPLALVGARILVVEDDPDTRRLVAALFECHGAEIHAVATAQE